MANRKLKLYIASSIDGYIAGPNGELDWLEGLPNPDQADYGYPAFIASIGTVVMGRKTYSEILGFDVDWPYADNDTVVISRNTKLDLPTVNTRLVNGNLAEAIPELKAVEGKDIWLVGGGELIAEFLRQGFIDEMIISVVPLVLGEGIPLFPSTMASTAFELLGAETFLSGLVNLSYRKK